MDKEKDLFEFINGIYSDQKSSFYDTLSDVEKKNYKQSRFMINRMLSMNFRYVPIINAIQQYSKIPDRAHYLFFANILPKGKQFNRYIKGKKEQKYDGWLVSLVSKHYSVSMNEAREYLEIYYETAKESLKKLCEMYGVDPKVIKKAKL